MRLLTHNNFLQRERREEEKTKGTNTCSSFFFSDCCCSWSISSPSKINTSLILFSSSVKVNLFIAFFFFKEEEDRKHQEEQLMAQLQRQNQELQQQLQQKVDFPFVIKGLVIKSNDNYCKNQIFNKNILHWQDVVPSATPSPQRIRLVQASTISQTGKEILLLFLCERNNILDIKRCLPPPSLF